MYRRMYPRRRRVSGYRDFSHYLRDRRRVRYDAPRDRWRRRTYGPSRTRRPRYETFHEWLDRYQDTPSLRRPETPEESEPETEPEPEPEPLKEEELVKELHVQKIDLHIQSNSDAHHTDEYECTEPKDSDNPYDPELIIRRGQEFLISIYMNRKYDINKDDLSLLFKTGENPTVVNGSSVEIAVVEEGEVEYKPFQWGARLMKSVKNVIDIAVFPPCTCSIGEWEISVKTLVQGKDGDDVTVWEYQCPDDVTVLFNPWCKDDEVYMSNVQDLDEYILNDAGVLYRGNTYAVGPKKWNFGQFDRGILNAAIHLMHMGFGYRSWGRNGDPVMISRVLSQVVNNTGMTTDDPNFGVLIGNWSGNYSGGQRPGSWTGSVKILRQFMETKKPVRYGQCWVFSGVLTTVCRALGIPCRSVTNFDSAHDTDVSLTIDRFVDENEDSIKRMNSDSVWNFHVWNEAYMKRPDLGDEFSGWQIIDSTPQESSEGVMCCGPAPQVAIKRGEVNVGQDTKFVFAEVNSDRITWLITKTGEYQVTRVNTSSVGHKISTHKPTGRPMEGGYHSRVSRDKDEKIERMDVTHLYKYPEKSKQEREAVKHAAQFSAMLHVRDPYMETAEETIVLEISTPDDIMVGANDFKVEITVSNISDEVRICRLTSVVRVVTYTGEMIGKPVHFEKSREIKVFPKKDENVSFMVDGLKAFENADEDFQFKIITKCIVKSGMTTDVQEFSHIFRYRLPEMDFEGPKKCRKNETITVKVSLANPLHIPLTQCVLDLEGSLTPVGATKDRMKVPDIPPRTTWTDELTLVARKSQRNKTIRDLTASFDTNELTNIDGTFVVQIVE